VVTPVVDVIAAVPVVGGAVGVIGLDDALTDAAASVDKTVDGVVSTVGQAATEIARGGLPAVAIADMVTPELELFPASTDNPRGVLDSAVGTVPPLARIVLAFTAASYSAVAGADVWRSTLADSASLSVTLGVAAAGILSSALSLGACAPARSSSSGPGGAGPGALALALLSPFAAHRAWVRRRGSENDDTPPAPFLATDVSPD